VNIHTPQENSSKYEVADIFRLYANRYLISNKVSKRQASIMSAIKNCRTPALGYHLDQCDNCGHLEREYNSCRDRHCPKCQGISQKRWIEARLEDVLPVSYYHAVFTLPHLLNDLISYNPKLIYELLLSKSAETLLQFGRDQRWLGGEIGFYGVLHTWGQTLWPHVHAHYVVPAGALTDNGQWIEPKYKGKFLFPVHALSIVFRGKFIQGLKEAYHRGDIEFSGDLANFSSEDQFEKWINKLVGRNWVVYCKRPFKDAESVVRYIGRYTHRVAISNNRIIDIKDGHVLFLYKDYKVSRSKWQQISLSADEFIRRFIWHVLPKGFHKIRHFGFLANGRSKQMVETIRSQLNETRLKNPDHESGMPKCPECETGVMLPFLVVSRIARWAFGGFYVAKYKLIYDSS
jgi:hypothetical protein